MRRLHGRPQKQSVAFSNKICMKFDIIWCHISLHSLYILHCNTCGHSVLAWHKTFSLSNSSVLSVKKQTKLNWTFSPFPATWSTLCGVFSFFVCSLKTRNYLICRLWKFCRGNPERGPMTSERRRIICTNVVPFYFPSWTVFSAVVVKHIAT